MSKMDERIIVAPRRRVFADERHAFQGFLPLDAPGAEAVLRGLCEEPREARRGDVEEDPSLLQPIPYVVVARPASAGGGEVFAYTRLAGGSERRLHGQVSIGVGGHMNLGFDAGSLERVVGEEAARELAEELCFRDGNGRELSPPPARLLGLINDDSDAVQQVHLGLLAVVEVPREVEVTVREVEQLDGRWTPLEELRGAEMDGRLESWSRHALRGLAATGAG